LVRALVFFALLLLPLHAEQVLFAQVRADLLFHTLLDAEAVKDYDGFMANGTDELKKTVSKRFFDDSSNILGPRLRKGFTVDSLGESRSTYRYRLHFKDGGDDMLATMSMKNGQLAGIVFK
jgi:hypothetical protein